MKIRASVVAVAVLLSIAFAGLVLAQGFPPVQMTQEFQTKWGTAKIKHFEGNVVSHDVACHCFVVKDARAAPSFRTTTRSSSRNTTRQKV